MKRWRVETRATVYRVYFVEAEHEKEAEAKSCDASCEISEDENEETISIIEIKDEKS